MFLWVLGKSLEALGLVQAAWALWQGLESHDSTYELKLLLWSVCLFLTGLFLTKISSKASS